jgi:hypothetical protein
VHRLLVIGAAVLAALVLNGPAEAWTWPADGAVVRPFSLGADSYAAGQHRGIDIGGAEGSPVRAPASGTVTFAGSLPTHGRGVTIATADGYAVTLVHLGSTTVAKGDVVVENAPVGVMGFSGDAEHAVPTVHLGIRVAAQDEGYVDPLGLLPAHPSVPEAPSPPAASPAPVAPPVTLAPTPAAAASAPAPAPGASTGPAPSSTSPAPSSIADATAPAAPVASAPAAATREAGGDQTAVTPATATQASAPTDGSSGTAIDPDPAPTASTAAEPEPFTVHSASSSPTRSPREPATATIAGTPPVPVRDAPHADARRTSLVGVADTGRSGDVGQPFVRRSATADAAAARAPTVRHVPTRASRRERVAGRARGTSDAATDNRPEHAVRAGRPTGSRAIDGRIGFARVPRLLPLTSDSPGLDTATIVAAIGLLALLAGAVARKAARRIGGNGAVLPHDADLLRQLDAAHRSRVHDRGGGRLRTPPTTARP